jgi:hypothetical protein
MAERKNLIRYSIRPISNGSILLLTTNDQQLILAIINSLIFSQPNIADNDHEQQQSYAEG